MKNTVIEKFKKGEKSIGTFTQLKSATAVEALGYTDFDFVVIDTEHTPVGIESAVEYVAAAQNAGLTPMVRVSGISRGPILRLLDAGAQALVVPCIETVELMKLRKLFNMLNTHQLDLEDFVQQEKRRRVGVCRTCIFWN